MNYFDIYNRFHKIFILSTISMTQKMEVYKVSVILFYLLQLFVSPSFARLWDVHNVSPGTASIDLKGMPFMVHKQEFPILTLGYGIFDAFEHAGNFDITDEIEEYEDFEPVGTFYYDDDIANIPFKSVLNSEKTVSLSFHENGEISISSINLLGIDISRM